MQTRRFCHAVGCLWIAASVSTPGAAQTCDHAWDPVSLPPRVGHAMAYDSHRQVLVCVGGHESEAACRTWEWDGVRWSLRNAGGPGAPAARERHAVVYDTLRHVTVLYGGDYNFSGPGFSDTWEWNGATWTQRAVSGPGPRTMAAMAFDSNRGVTVLFGGQSQPQSSQASIWEWNGTTWTENNAVGPVTRYGAQMAFDPVRRESLLFGGYFSYSGVSMFLNDTWAWDGERWVLRAMGGPPARYKFAMAFDLATDSVVIHGGSTGQGVPPLADTWIWNGAAWHEGPAAGPAGRRYHAMGFDASRSQLLLIGGTASINDGTASATYQPLADTWAWTGDAWTLADTLGPAALGRIAVAYDADRQRAVSVVGGVTWEWDGDSWDVRSSTGPSLRTGATLAYDAIRGVVTLFGGFSGSTPLNDTWEWNGDDWTLQTPNASPPARGHHGMAYHAARGETVIFGGRGAASSSLNDTWVWDGYNWSSVPGTAPSVRAYATLVYAEDRGVLVLQGGEAGSSRDDLWEWNGAWIQRVVTPRPSARSQHAAAFDAARGVMVMYGGVGVTSSSAWEWDGSGWTERTGVPFSFRYGHQMVYLPDRDATVLLGGYSTSGSNPLPGDFWTYNASHPVVTEQPAALTRFPGESAVFSVAAEGFEPYTYRWRRNGAPLIDGGPISGATTATLTIASVSSGRVGLYDVVVRGSCDRAVSQSAQLTLICPGDFDHDYDRDITDLAMLLSRFGGVPGEPYADGDVDGDGDVDLEDLAGLLGTFGSGC